MNLTEDKRYVSFKKEQNRQVDFLLIHKDSEDVERLVDYFENENSEGFQLYFEEEIIEESLGKIHYRMVHAPIETLGKGAEKMKGESKNYVFYTPILDRSVDEYTTAQRSAIVWYIMDKCMGDDIKSISSLIADEKVLRAIPVHEYLPEYLPEMTMGCKEICNNCCCGKISKCCCCGGKVSNYLNMRQFLYYKWALCLCKLPIKEITNYFGEKIARYFSMMGKYIIWLLIVLLVGLLFFVISFYTTNGAVNPAVGVCKARFEDYYMCPRCDRECDFWYLRQGVKQDCSRVVRLLFDNVAMWFYAILVIISAFFFVGCIFKKQALATPAPDPMTSQKSEPTMKDNCKECFCRKISSVIVFTIIFSVLVIGLNIMIGLFLNQSLTLGLFTLESERSLAHKSFARAGASIVATIISASIQGGVIIVVRFFYRKILQKIVCVGSQYSCANNWLERMYFIGLIFVDAPNSYIGVLYRVFFRGHFVGDPETGYKHVGVLRYEACPEYGCFLDLGIYIFTVMFVSKGMAPLLKLACCNLNILSNFCSNCCCKFCQNCCCYSCCFKCCCFKPCKRNDWCYKTCFFKPTNFVSLDSNNHRIDYELVEYYIDLVICYGFVVMFAIAGGPFPSAAAIIIALLTIQRNAKNYVLWSERPLPKPSTSVEPWKYFILLFTVLSTLTNPSIVISESRVLQHIAYSGSILKSSTLNFDGYLDKALPSHSLSLLIKARRSAFPRFELQCLPLRNITTGKNVKDQNGETILYLPFVDFSCLRRCTGREITYFTRKSYRQFYTSNDAQCLFKTDKRRVIKGIGDCFNDMATCRSRGFEKNTMEEEKLNMMRKLFVLTLIPGFFYSIVLVFIVIVICFIYGYVLYTRKKSCCTGRCGTGELYDV